MNTKNQQKTDKERFYKLGYSAGYVNGWQQAIEHRRSVVAMACDKDEPVLSTSSIIPEGNE